MSEIERGRRRPVRWVVLAAGLSLVLLTAAACGTGGGEAGAGGFQKVAPSDSLFAIEDLLSIGFKKNKQYDVAELPAGIDAWLGFWGPGPYSRKQYELRFYGSHEDAVEHGPALAEEVTGPDAGAFRKNPTWKEGAKDRWQSARGFSGALGEVKAGGSAPKYGDYVIFGNVLMLCEGVNSGQGLDRCEDLVDALAAGETE